MTEAVAWTAHVNATSAGSSLSKTTTVAGWDSGAVSTRAINSPDGYMEAVASTTGIRMFGLSNGNTDTTYQDIDFAFYLSGAAVSIYEAGTLRGNFGTVANGDLVRVSIEGGVVKYRKNGTLLYTSTVAPTYPLLVDASLNSVAVHIDGVVISGALVDSRLALPAANPVAGGYALPINVALASAPGATIRYTVNGATPTSASPRSSKRWGARSAAMRVL